MKICGIYKIVSPSNKIYIGQSVDIIKRWDTYKHNKAIGQTHLCNSFEKYGWDSHKFEIICQCDKDRLDDLEKYYIELYQTFNSKYGLNLQSGGSKNHSCSEETRKKIGNAHRGKIVSEETRKKLSEGHKGLPSGRKGKKNTQEHREKISKSNSNRILSEETKKKMSESSKKSMTDDLRKRISDGQKQMNNDEMPNRFKKGFVPWNKGKTGVYSDETLNKIRDARKSQIITKESYEKMAESLRGKKRTEEQKRNMSDAQRIRFPFPLTSDQIKYLHNNYKTKSKKELADKFNVTFNWLKRYMAKNKLYRTKNDC